MTGVKYVDAHTLSGSDLILVIFNFMLLHCHLYCDVMRTITLGKTESVVAKSTKRLRANLEKWKTIE